MLAKTPRVLFVFFNTNSSLFFFKQYRLFTLLTVKMFFLLLSTYIAYVFYNKLIIVIIVL